ncbi:TPA: DUF2726 domain-containing protein [Escherichia coli]|uniref:DUF2726 domain-containing protein n=9 Tax=Escherichia coli TaxID=562 RepID=A0A836ZBV4_ECOLX|nr:DUF2726 domain-containing protein [Escherichia coli]EGO3764513.1 DUF2726 domain-containing protein [Escherichia coli]EQU05258.1 hypothetical protein G849_05066 [Escherichia coli HVH 197 (4-4466217)]KEJ40243.1 hypothetical protein AD31_5424 [Escherichia coli 2-427-07_S4_C3]KEJ77887.1 hypothetical protein AC88_5326 [Escherichia coli 3-267-03_S4_C1]KEO22362.1 hypothetical protein AB05_5403 [Escherichia coli 2-460-02_S1_C1]
MKLIIFILIVLIIASLLIRIILRSVNQHSPLLMQLHAAGIRTGDAERILSSGEYWQRQKTLLTEREVSFMKGLIRIVDMKRWYLCPQVRGADIVQLNGNIRPRSRQWWQLFRMVSQWHVDVVIVERRSFSIVAAVELDDASHLRPERRRRDILLEEVLRQAGIPLLRSYDARKLLQMTGEWLDTFRTDLQSEPEGSRGENVHRFTRQQQASETAVWKVKSDSCTEGNK